MILKSHLSDHIPLLSPFHSLPNSILDHEQGRSSVGLHWLGSTVMAQNRVGKQRLVSVLWCLRSQMSSGDDWVEKAGISWRLAHLQRTLSGHWKLMLSIVWDLNCGYQTEHLHLAMSYVFLLPQGMVTEFKSVYPRPTRKKLCFLLWPDFWGYIAAVTPWPQAHPYEGREHRTPSTGGESVTHCKNSMWDGKSLWGHLGERKLSQMQWEEHNINFEIFLLKMCNVKLNTRQF